MRSFALVLCAAVALSGAADAARQSRQYTYGAATTAGGSRFVVHAQQHRPSYTYAYPTSAVAAKPTATTTTSASSR